MKTQREIILAAADILDVPAPDAGALGDAALALMLIEDDHAWSMAMWTRPQDRSLRLAACAARREAIDAVSQRIFP